MADETVSTEVKTLHTKGRVGKRGKKVIIYILALILFVWLIAPFGWLIVMSFMIEDDIFAGYMYPHTPVVQNYGQMLTQKFEQVGKTTASKVLPGIRNSVIVCLSVVAINLLVGTLSGYAFARFRYRGLRYSFLALLLTRMVPPIAIIIPFFVMFKNAGMLNSFPALIISYTSFTIPFTAWIMKGYFDTIPTDLDDAGLVDGCSRLQVISKIILPISAPGMVASAIFVFLVSWNEFIFAALLTRNIEAQTITVVLSLFVAQYWIEYGVLAAAGILAVIPPILLALLFQRYLVQGLVAGAVKG
jgi:multiple sugar transport system permease protein